MEQNSEKKSSIRNKIMVSFFIVLIALGIGLSLVIQTVLKKTLVEHEIPEAITQQIISHFTIYSLGLVIAGIILSLLIALALSNHISKPIKNLTDIVEKIGSGKFESKIESDLRSSGDEIGELATNINKMADYLKNYEKKLLESERGKGVLLKKEVDKKTKELNQKVKDLNNTKKAILNMMEDMSKANKELKELDKSKSEFLNIVSHELKTPLTALIAHLEVIEDMKSNLTKEELNSLEAIRRNSDNLKMLISNILEIARMESGKFELTKINLNLEKLIKESARELQILAKQKSLNIRTKIKKLPKIKADDTRLKEIMNNLITNAIKFTERGSITISAQKKGGFVEVKVADTGVGIPNNKIKNIFQKFYQVDTSISRRYGGTGLGLSITKKIIENHGGEIKVDSIKGKGTIFTFTLPIKTQENEKVSVKKKELKDPFANVNSQIKEFIKRKELKGGK